MATGYNNNDLLKAYGIQINHVPRPRAPPMFIRPPSPLILERPQPLVSDVSLIIDSASTSLYSTVSAADSTPEEVNHGSYASNLASSNNRALSSSHNGSGSNTTADMGTPNFANYFPTPSLNQSQSRGVGDENSCSKDDSGHGTSALTSSRNNIGDRDDDDTVASETLEEEPSPRPRIVRSESEDIKLLRSDVASLTQLIVQQQGVINNLNSQILAIVSFQEKIAQLCLPKSLSSSTSKEVQTDDSTNTNSPTTTTHSKLDKLSPALQKTPEPNAKSKSPATTTSSKSPLPERPVKTKDTSKGRVAQLKVQEQPAIASPSSSGARNIDDFSTLLKHLPIDPLQKQSMYSNTQASIRPLELSQFQEESFQDVDGSRVSSPYIGPSASAFGSSSEDDEELPETPVHTAAYYNNMLTTVNRFLDTKNTNGRMTSPTAMNQGNSPFHANHFTNQPPRMPFNSSNNLPPSGRASTASYGSSSSGDQSVKNILHGGNANQYQHSPRPPTQSVPSPTTHAANVVDVTKRYLESIGAQFDSPTPNNDRGNSHPSMEKGANHQQQNYMIQQNVFNSIYIPTVNCVPVLGESYNSNSGIMDSLANKYIPPADLNQYESLRNQNQGGMTETTVYGMSSNNLSFATKQYLQRYGLVGQGHAPVQSVDAPLVSSSANHFAPIVSAPSSHKTDRILDITAIRNQPKLL